MTSEGAPVVQNNSNTNSTDIPSTSSTYQQTCCANHANIQILKQRKIELDKKLNEKCKLLSQIIRDENNLLKLASTNQNGTSSATTPCSTMQSSSSLRRKILGTTHLLNSTTGQSAGSSSGKSIINVTKKSDEGINQLLLEKKQQQQIAEAALKLANDITQTKLIRKTHKQCYDMAQDKLKAIEKNILLMQLQQTTNDNGKHIVRHNSMKLTMPTTISTNPVQLNQVRYQHAGKISPLGYYPYTNTIPSIGGGHKQQIFNTSKDAKIKKSAFLDSEYNFSSKNNEAQTTGGGGGGGGSTQYNDVQYLTAAEFNSPNNYGNANTMDDDFSLYHYQSSPNPNGTAHHYNAKMKQPQPPHQNGGGLGGYWYTMENNERIWCTMDNRFSSLDRKTNQIVKTTQVQPKTNPVQAPTKSTSLGNFEFISSNSPNINKQDEIFDSISISSISSENKKPKEKVWSETSLDSPVLSPPPIHKPNLMYNNSNNNNGGSIDENGIHNNHERLGGGGGDDCNKAPSPQLYHYYNNQNNRGHQTKPKLSSHSMSLPNRNFSTATTTANYPMVLSNAVAADCYDDLYLNMSPYHQDYYQSIHSDIVAVNNKSPTARTIHSNNRIMTSSPVQLHSPTTTATSVVATETIRIESPKNITVIQQAKFRPYKEISKPFEMADFYKYSTKFRQKNINSGNDSGGTVANKISDGNRTDLDDLNLQTIQKIYYQPPNPSLCQPINYQ